MYLGLLPGTYIQGSCITKKPTRVWVITQRLHHWGFLYDLQETGNNTKTVSSRVLHMIFKKLNWPKSHWKSLATCPHCLYDHGKGFCRPCKFQEVPETCGLLLLNFVTCTFFLSLNEPPFKMGMLQLRGSCYIIAIDNGQTHPLMTHVFMVQNTQSTNTSQWYYYHNSEALKGTMTR